MLDKQAKRLFVLTLGVAVLLIGGDYLLGPLLYMAAAATTVVSALSRRNPPSLAPMRIRLLAIAGMTAGACAIVLLPAANQAAAPNLMVFGKALPVNMARVGLLLALLALAERRVGAPKTRIPASAWLAIVLCAVAYLAEPSAARGTSERLSAACGDSMREIMSAMQAYLDEHEGVFPSCEEYPASLEPYLKEPLPVCPATHNAYAYNGAVAGLAISKLSTLEKTIVFFEGSTREPICDGPAALPESPSHFAGDVYGFADGNVRHVPRVNLGRNRQCQFTWAKEPDADWVIWEPVLREGDKDP